MFSNTQMLMFASLLVENDKSIRNGKPKKGLVLLREFGQIASYEGGDIIPDLAFDKTEQRLIPILGKLSVLLTDTPVTTWDESALDEKSLDNVVDAFLKIDPNSDGSNSDVDGQRIIDSLPPMISHYIRKIVKTNEVISSFSSNEEDDQQSSNVSKNNKETKPTKLDESVKEMNRQTLNPDSYLMDEDI